MDEMNIDELVEQEFEAQLRAGLLPVPQPRKLRLTYDIETRNNGVVSRSKIVPEPMLEAEINQLLNRGAFNFNY